MKDQVNLEVLREAIEEHEAERFAKRFREAAMYGSPEQADIYRRYTAKMQAKYKADKAHATFCAICLGLLLLWVVADNFYEIWKRGLL